MKKMNIFLIISGLIVSIVLLTSIGCKSIYSNRQKRPILEIPVTYNIGWWANQKMLSIDSLHIEVVESYLNLMNAKSIVSYRVGGHLTYGGQWQPKITEVHISERMCHDTMSHYDRIVEITPIVKTKRNEKVNGGSDRFEFTNEHIITSNQWGINRIKFVCGQSEQVIELRQKK
jgi:hypothetical protein